MIIIIIILIISSNSSSNSSSSSSSSSSRTCPHCVQLWSFRIPQATLCNTPMQVSPTKCPYTLPAFCCLAPSERHIRARGFAPGLQVGTAGELRERADAAYRHIERYGVTSCHAVTLLRYYYYYSAPVNIRVLIPVNPIHSYVFLYIPMYSYNSCDVVWHSTMWH